MRRLAVSLREKIPMQQIFCHDLAMYRSHVLRYMSAFYSYVPYDRHALRDYLPKP